MLSQRGTLSVLEALEIVRQCLEASRPRPGVSDPPDPWPGNFRLRADGHAELVAGPPAPPEYCPPEEKALACPDTRAGFYRIGLTLYRAVTGKACLPGLTGRPADPQELYLAIQRLPGEFPHFSFGLVHLLQRALAAQPWQRYQSTEEFLADIESVRISLMPRAKPVPRGTPVAMAARPRMPADTLALLLGGALSLALLGFWGLGRHPERAGKPTAAPSVTNAAQSRTSTSALEAPGNGEKNTPPAPVQTALATATVSVSVAQSGGGGPESAETPAPPFTSKVERAWPKASGQILAFFTDLSGPLEDEHARILAHHWAGGIELPASLVQRLRRIHPGFLALHRELALGVWKGPSVLVGDERVPVDAILAESPDLFLGLELTTRRQTWRLANLDSRWGRAWPEQVYPRVLKNDADGVLVDHCHPPPTSAGLLDAPANQPGWWRKHVPQFLEAVSRRLGPGCPVLVHLPDQVEVKDPTLYASAGGVRLANALAADLDSQAWLALVGRALAFSHRGQTLLLDLQVTSNMTPAERVFLVATYLLVQNSRTYVCLSLANPEERLWLPEMDIDLGEPEFRPPARPEGLLHPEWQVYARKFQDGLVLVNPGEARLIALPEPMDRITPEGVGRLSPSGGTTPRKLQHEFVRRITLQYQEAAILAKPRELPPETPEGGIVSPEDSIDLLPE